MTTKCYDQFCLTSDFILKQYNEYAEFNQVCVYLGNQWLLEIYNPSVQSNVDDFLRIHNNILGDNNVLQKLLVPINLRLITSSDTWTWITGERAAERIDVQFENVPLQFAYLNITSLGASINADVATSIKSVICMLKGNCPVNISSSWIYLNMCYFNIEGLFNWYDAINDCSYYNATLASFPNIVPQIDKTWLSSNNYWIGLMRCNWIWRSNSKSVTYFNWLNKVPYQNIYYQQNLNEIYYFRTNVDSNRWIVSIYPQNNYYIVICMSNNTNLTTTSLSPSIPTSQTIQINPNYVSSTIYASNASVNNSSPSNSIGLTIGLAVGIPVYIILVVAAILAIYFFRKKHNLNGRLASFPHKQRFGTLISTIGSFVVGELSKGRPDLQPFPPPVDDQRESPYAEPISLDQCVDGDIYGTVMRGLAKSKDNDLFYPQLVWKKDMNSIYVNGDLMGGDANNGGTTRDEQ